MTPEQRKNKHGYDRSYYLRHREDILRKHRAWLAVHGRGKPSETAKLHKKEYNKAYYEKNKAKISERKRLAYLRKKSCGE